MCCFFSADQDIPHDPTPSLAVEAIDWEEDGPVTLPPPPSRVFRGHRHILLSVEWA